MEELNERFSATVQRAVERLGADVRDARRRRRIGTALMAERAGIGRPTLYRAEKGDPTVAMGTYATLLEILGLLDRLAEVADLRFDPLGQALDEERLPKRIRARRS